MSSSIAFLGPEGTFAHLAAVKRYGSKNLVGLPSVKEVFDFVNADPRRKGVVPIENSSGGTIYETVDRLVDENYNLLIQESLSVNVRLALLGKNKKNISVIYSHFAPLTHCEPWIQEHYPKAECMSTSSTMVAVEAAAKHPNSAAIGHRTAGKIYKLKVLEFPIGRGGANVTQFFVIGHKKNEAERTDRTSLIVSLPNKPGALHEFLGPLSDEGIDLTRILSRPIAGKPNSYVFLLDIKGKPSDPRVKKALNKAGKSAERWRSIGSYRLTDTYES